MLCRYCYEDLGLLGQKKHVCVAKKYIQKPDKTARENERAVYDGKHNKPKKDEYCTKCVFSHFNPCEV